MLPCAGTTSLSFKYSNCLNTKVIVTKLKQRSQSAGNFAYFSDESTSETLRNKSELPNSCKKVSVHEPIHSNPLTDNEFGHYLAGLIDGDGHFSKAQQLVITFSSPDAFLAYYLKERLGYGNVRKVKDKNAYLLIVSNKKGMLNVINLINGKLKTEHRFNQLVNNILSDKCYANENINFHRSYSSNFKNHWLAGFSDADASFQIKIIKRITSNKPEVRLNFQIDHKSDLTLNMIKQSLGGNIGYRKSQDTYYYGSTNFGSAKRVIEYFDRYHLQSRKHISYLRWRKVYRLIQYKEHLTDKGLSKILKIKSLINRHEENTRT